jgi:hypothetical protein
MVEGTLGLVVKILLILQCPPSLVYSSLFPPIYVLLYPLPNFPPLAAKSFARLAPRSCPALARYCIFRNFSATSLLKSSVHSISISWRAPLIVEFIPCRLPFSSSSSLNIIYFTPSHSLEADPVVQRSKAISQLLPYSRLSKYMAIERGIA